MTLPTAAVVRTHGIPQLGASTLEDTNITTLIARADAVLAEWCGFPAASSSAAPTLEATTYTHYYDGPSPFDATMLTLSVRPVTSVTSIHDDTDRNWTYDAADLVDSGDYTLDEIEGRIYLHNDSNHGTWRTGRRTIKAIYVAGYDTGSDGRITQGITALVAHWWSQRPNAGMDTLTVGDVTVTPEDRQIPPHVREIMWPIRLAENGLG